MKRITVKEMISMADAELHRRLIEMLAAGHEGAGFVVYQNRQMDSSNAGHCTFLVFGDPYSMKTMDEVVKKHPWLGDLPSQRQYPVAYCIKGDPS